MIDLHTHSFHSDGAWCPAELARRAEEAGYRAVAITDHADSSNMDDLLTALLRFIQETQPFLKVRVIPGIELTHVPPAQVAGLARRARQMGAKVVILHGETICEPVKLGTNRAGIEAGVDVIAHPGLISEEDAQLAAENGVYLEITTRRSHGLGNGRVARIARETGAPLVINSDAHAGGDLMSPEWRERVAFGAGLLPEEIARINRNMLTLVERISPTSYTA